MARKPISQYAGGKGPRQQTWEAIRRLVAADAEATFTDDQIWRSLTRAARLNMEMGTIRDYRRALVAAGILAVATAARNRRVKATYRLLKNEGIEAPRVRKDGSRVTQGLAQEQMWRTLRTLKGDTNARELAAYASTDQVPVAEVAAKDYLLHLFQANYLERTAEGKGIHKGGIQARYRLISNTGPRPPMVQRTDAIYDPNLGVVIWVKPVNEETAIYGH